MPNQQRARCGFLPPAGDVVPGDDVCRDVVGARTATSGAVLRRGMGHQREAERGTEEESAEARIADPRPVHQKTVRGELLHLPRWRVEELDRQGLTSPT